MVRTELAADDSFAAIRARSRFGMAIAAMIRMIATTISNSISEKPFCFRISIFSSSECDFFNLVSIDRRHDLSHLPCQSRDRPELCWHQRLNVHIFRLRGAFGNLEP